jgi:hypothetical protein
MMGRCRPGGASVATSNRLRRQAKLAGERDGLGEIVCAANAFFALAADRDAEADQSEAASSATVRSHKMLEHSWQPHRSHDLSSMDETDNKLVLVLGDNMQTATLRMIAVAAAIAAVIATVARFLS